MAYKVIDSYRGEYEWLSNFYLCIIEYEGLAYPSLENAYQAAKFQPEKRHLFLNCTAGYAKRLGRRKSLGQMHGLVISPDWNDRRIPVMKALIDYKFSFEHHAGLAKLLIATFPKILIEGNTWGDYFWGQCDGVGENHLGTLQANRREELMFQLEEQHMVLFNSGSSETFNNAE